MVSPRLLHELGSQHQPLIADLLHSEILPVVHQPPVSRHAVVLLGRVPQVASVLEPHQSWRDGEVSGVVLVVGAGPDEPQGGAEPPAPLTGHDSARAPRLHPEIDVRPVRAPKIGGRCERPGGARGDGGGRGVRGDEAGGFAPPLPFGHRRRQTQHQRCRGRYKHQRRPAPPRASRWLLLLPQFRVPVPEPLPGPFLGSTPGAPPPLARHQGCRARDVSAAPPVPMPIPRAPPGGQEEHGQARSSGGHRGAQTGPEGGQRHRRVSPTSPATPSTLLTSGLLGLLISSTSPGIPK